MTDMKGSIIFVHGLNPVGNENHGNKTWTTDRGTLWPKDLLPSRIKRARMMLFEYNSNVVLMLRKRIYGGTLHLCWNQYKE